MADSRHVLNGLTTILTRWRGDIEYSDAAAMRDVLEYLAPRAELLKRELHHFEAEQAMTRALAVLESHEPGEEDRLERIYQAENILRGAL